MARHICHEHHARSRSPERAPALVYRLFSSYCLRWRLFAFHALMMRILSPRSVCGTTSRFPRLERPRIAHRSSPIECSGSGMVIESQSANTVVASSNDMRRFLRFCCAFRGSHSNFTPRFYPGAAGAPPERRRHSLLGGSASVTPRSFAGLSTCRFWARRPADFGRRRLFWKGADWHTIERRQVVSMPKAGRSERHSLRLCKYRNP